MRTPLYDAHVAAGARLVEFAGYELPLNYPTGIQAEHLAVRTASGLFDVSHMGEVRVSGPDATRFLSYYTLNDPAKLTPGRGQYSMIPNDQGGLIDDIYLYCDAEAEYLIVCNAANRQAVVRHLQLASQAYDVRVVDESDSWALLALQGPGAALVLGRVVEDDVAALKKNRKMAARFRDTTLEVARTGYTGEDGFELFCRPQDAMALWQAVVELGATPCGLGARDTLRLEAGFPLFGHEWDATTNPRCSDYAWVVKDKPFFGREKIWEAPCRERLVGLKLEQRGVARQGYAILFEGRTVGRVTSGTISPLTREAIAMGWLAAELAEVGTAVEVEVRAQHLPARVVAPPFYTPS